MDGIFLKPWLPAPGPDLMRLAMAAADAAGINRCDAWPELRNGGVGFGSLPVFLPWHGLRQGRHHLVLVQPREVGSLVPGARTVPLPEQWLEDLDLGALARPLAAHPDFPGGASVHVVGILGPGRAKVRTQGEGCEAVVAGVLARISAVEAWAIRPG